MTTARDIMHIGAECIGMHDTLETAARRMRELDVGALPICGDDGRLAGMLTDRDIVVKCVAGGLDPMATTVQELAQGRTWTIEANAEVDAVLETMESHQIRRLPVIDDKLLVGIISEADLSHHLPASTVGVFVEAVSAGSSSSG